jgi:hypothetical protein
MKGIEYLFTTAVRQVFHPHGAHAERAKFERNKPITENSDIESSSAFVALSFKMKNNKEMNS